ncbi:MAG: hypothetical protein J1F38_09830 [Muribaculaceae bacterium]|nr:hypothetical protein [Muribaculaceae bacterium]
MWRFHLDAPQLSTRCARFDQWVNILQSLRDSLTTYNLQLTTPNSLIPHSSQLAALVSMTNGLIFFSRSATLSQLTTYNSQLISPHIPGSNSLTRNATVE